VALQRAAARAGIPLPLPVTTADDVAVVQVGGRSARVYEWADLGPPLTVPVPPGTAAEAGRLLGLLHGLGRIPADPPDAWYTEIKPDAYWPELAARGAAAGAPWASDLAAAREVIAELGAQVVPPAGQPLLACHRDFNPDNVLPAAPDGRLMVLDWENSGLLSPVRELGYAIFAWCTGDSRFDPAAADALVASYAQAAGTVPDLGEDLFATAIATHLNVLHVMAEQWLADPARRDYTESLISDLLTSYLGDLQAVTGPGADWPRRPARPADGTLTAEERMPR
jgi:Ser/Thr protein kinase RdoA (MazF antagonist)